MGPLGMGPGGMPLWPMPGSVGSNYPPGTLGPAPGSTPGAGPGTPVSRNFTTLVDRFAQKSAWQTVMR
jgi:hypothetical protein